jgi:hypothetical protein
VLIDWDWESFLSFKEDLPENIQVFGLLVKDDVGDSLMVVSRKESQRRGE